MNGLFSIDCAKSPFSLSAKTSEEALQRTYGRVRNGSGVPLRCSAVCLGATASLFCPIPPSGAVNIRLHHGEPGSLMCGDISLPLGDPVDRDRFVRFVCWYLFSICHTFQFVSRSNKDVFLMINFSVKSRITVNQSILLVSPSRRRPGGLLISRDPGDVTR